MVSSKVLKIIIAVSILILSIMTLILVIFGNDSKHLVLTYIAGIGIMFQTLWIINLNERIIKLESDLNERELERLKRIRYNSSSQL